MTAEIAIMNKTAVALAADSAVTIEHEEGKKTKIYHTNKLFALSKYHPVGIMIYGNAEFMGVPWETIIKVYRRKLNKKKFGKIEEYAKDFLKFLKNDKNLISESDQRNYLYITTFSYFFIIKYEIDNQVKFIIEKDGKIKDSQIKNIINKTIKKHYDVWNKAKLLPSITKINISEIIKKYGNELNKAKEEVFKKLPISNVSYELLTKIIGCLFSKSRGIFRGNVSGIVITGFGEDEKFPFLKTYLIEAKVNNVLKYSEDRNKSGEVDFFTNAIIIPFAESDMVYTFMEGVHPKYISSLESYLNKLLKEAYPNNITEYLIKINKINKNEKIKIVEELSKIGINLVDSYVKSINYDRIKMHVNPILDAVAVLPKDEIASMAEYLVNLTLLKLKYSMGEEETVGGPIDVAVISKGDGFIWIKRKHYFKSELNPNFIANYYR